jgi:hypothetical protein
MTKQMSKIENQPTDDLNEPDDNKPQQARQQLIAQTALNIHQGPLPSPEILMGYIMKRCLMRPIELLIKRPYQK